MHKEIVVRHYVECDFEEDLILKKKIEVVC